MTGERLQQLEALCGVEWAQGWGSSDSYSHEFYDEEGNWLGSTASEDITASLVAVHNALPELLEEFRELRAA